jgi:hypothetical protein
MKNIKAATIGPAPDLKSKVSPTGVPTVLRHLVAYHNPDTMGYEFWECQGFSVLTNHKYNHLENDVVWVFGRPSGATAYYLDCKFRIASVTTLPTGADFRYRVSAMDGFVFFPYVRLNNKPWFKRLLAINPHLSLGLQVVNDSLVLQGLKNEYEVAKGWQDASVQKPHTKVTHLPLSGF